MKNQKEPQKRLDLEEFLSKCSSLEKLLESSHQLTRETRENIEWFCDYRVHQYYERYKNELKWEAKINKKYNSGAK